MKKKLNLKMHIMTGISFMIPVIVAGGILYALAKGFGGWDIGDQAETTNSITKLWFNVNFLASTAMNFAIAVLCAGIGYSIAGKPAIAPGLIIGYVSVQIKAGFLGAILMGLIIGYVVSWMLTWKLPSWAKSLLPLMIIPILSTLVCGLLFIYVIGQPIVTIVEKLSIFITGLQSGSKFVLGAFIGACMGFDMGGPVNKTASAVANGLLSDGVYGPVTSKIVGGMTPPLGIGLSTLIAPKKFSQQEKDMGKAAIPMGLCFITEGVLPFAAADPVKVIISSMLGSSLAGGLTLVLGVESMATHGGIFIVPLMTNPFGFLIALAAGSALTAIVYAVIRKQPENDAHEEEKIEELDLDIQF